MQGGRADDVRVQSHKLPPSWGPDQEARYPFRTWARDLALWDAANDIEDVRKGPMVALRLTGAARELIRDLPFDSLVNGVQVIGGDGAPRQLTGLQVLLQAIERRFAPNQQELAVRALSEYMGISRASGETVDEFLSRWEIARSRAAQQAGFAMGEPGQAWSLLNLLRIPADCWTLILAETGGNLPVNADQLARLVGVLRRTGRLYERAGDPSESLR